MSHRDGPDVGLAPTTVRRLREILAAHDVEIAILFGSAADPAAEPADIDLAIAFEDYQPTDPGYADVYLDLLSHLDDLGRDIDLVDLRTMESRFASVVFEQGVLLVGSPDRRDTLAEQLIDTEATLEDARERVAAAASRLREQPP